CRSLGLEVTAEGIECPEQLALLADLAPIYLQGYLLARPVPAEKLLAVIGALPNHMQSLLLTSPAIAPPVESTDPVGARSRAVARANAQTGVAVRPSFENSGGLWRIVLWMRNCQRADFACRVETIFPIALA